MLLAIVIACTGLLLMILGAAYFLSRLGDVPSRKSVAADTSDEPKNENPPVQRKVAKAPATTLR